MHKPRAQHGQIFTPSPARHFRQAWHPESGSLGPKPPALGRMDVDGTMTDGGVILLSQTEEIALENKTFDAHDGQGLTLAHTTGLRTGCITGRQSSALLRRAREMNMEFIYMKQALKMPAYEQIVRKAAVSDAVVAYVGDDLPDLPVMRRVGLAVAVGNAGSRGQRDSALHNQSPGRPWCNPRNR